MTQSIGDLARRLNTPEMDWTAQTENNVTANGEAAASLYRSVDIGQRQICYVASGYLSTRVPELAALDLPFCVSDRRAALHALDGDAGRYLTSVIETRTGYKVLGFWDNGFRHISNHVRPLHCANDCKGLVIRTLDSATYRDTLSAMGFSPRTTDVKDLVRVVQQHEVDAQENPLTNLVNFGIWRHHPHVSLTGHFFGVALLVCNKAWFANLTSREQLGLLDAAAHSTRLQRQMAAAEDDSLTRYLLEQGVALLRTRDLDIDSMRQATRSIVEHQRQLLPPQLVHAYLDQVAA